MVRQGTIQDVIFYSQTDGFTVAVMAVDEAADGGEAAFADRAPEGKEHDAPGNTDSEGDGEAESGAGESTAGSPELLTICGQLPSCHAGRTYRIRGRMVQHPKYGEQFEIQEYEEVMPHSEAGIIGFLSSGVLKGIGPKAARAIVARFGEDTFEMIEKEPERLTEVSGIGPKKARAVAEAFRSHRAFAEVSIFLQQYDIRGGQALRLYEAYGEETIPMLQSNPYQLIDDVHGIGFRRADAIARRLGVPEDDPDRIRSGIQYLLQREAGEGNTCCPKTEFCEKAGQLLNVPRDTVAAHVVELCFTGELKLEELDGEENIYLFLYYAAEQSVTRHLRRLNSAAPRSVSAAADIEGLISQTENAADLFYSEEQKEAIRSCLQSGVAVITGGPGTGKTTIINAIVRILEQSGQKVVLAAPTGRAAKRITETSGHAASTIHRLLEYYYSEGEGLMRFGRTEENPLEADAVIVDEASMIDLMLMDALVRAIPAGARLLLVGDADQLPSVGAGNVLHDILDSEYIYAARLETIFRQAGESMIVVNAHRINRGEDPVCNARGKDFFLMRRHTVADMAATILEICSRRLPAHYTDCDAVHDIQVLTPVRKGPLGCLSLTGELQRVLNPPDPHKAEKSYGGKLFREGDKVMQMRNNYSRKWKRAGDFSEGEGVFNGDLGYISAIDEEDGEVTVVFDDDKYAVYETADLDELEVAYAITVHKSQGSEFPIVVMPVSWFPPVLATRNLLYTAVTRGKKIVVLVGSENRLHDMVGNNRIRQRRSGLCIRLRRLLTENAE
ncbi:MAG: ATP-dependent RecD-like DNA helicase [Anaerovoracaceae bacterium]|jgi:exodeoxyribonuclease V alpha subunit